MSTLQHISRSGLQSRLARRILVAALAAAAATALCIALIGGGSNSSSASAPSSDSAHVAHPSAAQLHRQLEAVSGARFGSGR